VKVEGIQVMSKTSWVELWVSDFEQSITWFENVLGFRVVALEADEYAELSRGESAIQLAPDHAPYWASERPRLLPSGQRGSGVEIALLVDDVDAIYRQAMQAQAEIVREIADYPWHMRQFWVRHPDGYLIRPAQKILSLNPATTTTTEKSGTFQKKRDWRSLSGSVSKRWATVWLMNGPIG
jgi:catechol 2,3-dioxygenase-like lactoylglutathione lyase family enzyme